MKMYADFAGWWHLLSAVEEYAEEAAVYAKLLREIGDRPAQTVLELGAGGGNNAFYLKRDFAMTLSDIAPEMLEQSAIVNAECEHVAGDMLTLRLDKQFDRVFIHDAIAYVTTREGLRQALETAFVHCKPGGAALICPDYTRETFEASTDCGGNDLGDRGIRYLEWVHAPEEDSITYEVDYILAMRDGSKPTQVFTERHVEGLFSQAEWLDVLRDVGFDATIVHPNRDDIWHPDQAFFSGLRRG